MILEIFPLINFPNNGVRVLFSIIFLIVFLVEVRILLRYRNKKDDKKSLNYILLGIFLPLFLAIWLSFHYFGAIDNRFSYLGIVLIIAGFVLRQSSIFSLKKFFVPIVAKQKGHRLIRSGPYRFLRHPSYTGLFLEVVGVGFGLSNIVPVVLAIVLLLPAIIYRIRIEENFLMNNLRGYRDYMKDTWKLLPLVY
tara:strand:+ start:3445 stop:4026 length:582 start_codon:yes stop_codon:yes gene_type:complete